VDFFFRHYDSRCYMPERGRIHDAASNASPISPDHETSSDRRRAACDNRCRLCGLCVLLRDWHEPEKARPHRRAFFPKFKLRPYLHSEDWTGYFCYADAGVGQNEDVLLEIESPPSSRLVARCSIRFQVSTRRESYTSSTIRSYRRAAGKGAQKGSCGARGLK
jgi:hypothetical protein